MSAVMSETATTQALESETVHSDLSCNEKTPLLSAPGNDVQANVKDDSESNGKDFSFFNLPRRSKSILLLCSMSNFFVCCSFSILGPFFPKEAEKKGLSTETIGFIFSVFELIIFLTSPIYGNFLARIGTKFVLVSGICVGGSCSVLFGLLDKCPPGITFSGMCFACRSLEALAFSAFITASFAVLSNEFPKHVATVLGITETAAGMGMMVGPALGGALYELNGYGTPFFVLGGLIIVSGLVLAALLPETQEVPAKRKGSLRTLLVSPMVILPMISIFLCSVGITFMDPTFAQHLDPFHLSTAEVGLMFVIGPALYAFFSPLWGYLVDNKNFIGSLVVIGQLGYGISFFLLGPSPWLPFLPSALWLIVIGSVLLGIGIGMVAVPNIKCLVLGALEVGWEDNLDTYAVVSGLFNSVFSLGGFVGPTLGGVMVGQLGFDLSASVVGSANIFMCLVLLPFFMRRYCLKERTKKTSDQAPPLTQEDRGHSDV